MNLLMWLLGIVMFLAIAGALAGTPLVIATFVLGVLALALIAAGVIRLR